MLRFFRHIRKGLIDSSSTRKYILYAVGEILLVMIGILLALQVNNWNEWRKDRVKETEVLNDLLKNLELNRELLMNTIDDHGTFDNSAQVILRAFKEDQPYHDSLSHHFLQAKRVGTTLTTLTKSGYESMKNAGFDIIRSKTLKDEIIFLFEHVHQQFDQVARYIDHRDTPLLSVYLDHFWQDAGYRYVPNNYEELKENRRYYSVLNDGLRMRSWLRIQMDKVLKQNSKVDQLIRDELEIFQ